MTDKRELGELLQEALDAIDEIGGHERHTLAQTIGRETYDKLISRPRTENLIHRCLNATGKAKKPATKALAIAVARISDTPAMVSRIENELADSFDLPAEKPKKAGSNLGTEASRPTAGQVEKHREAADQRHLGQRVFFVAARRFERGLLLVPLSPNSVNLPLDEPL